MEHDSIYSDPYESGTYFAEIILPLAVGNTFTYRIPQKILEEVLTGKRVLVPFGRNKTYSGIVLEIHEQAPLNYEAKYISSILDSEPIISESYLDFWTWMSRYYACHLGEVMKAALPSGLKLETESYLVLNEDHQDPEGELSSKEKLILDILQDRREIKILDLSIEVGIKFLLPLIKDLLAKNLVLIKEELSRGYIPKKQVFIRLNEKFEDPEPRKELFEELEKRPAQLRALMNFFKLRMGENSEIPQSELAKESSHSIIQSLLKRGVLESFTKRISRLENNMGGELVHHQLSPTQKKAFDQINEQFQSKEVVLLHGITSSGKTEIYLELMEANLIAGFQTLFLLPEIALTAQLVHRLQKKFGAQVGIYHSLFGENERVETWEKVLKGEYTMVIGARSALFLPFPNLGLIIIDEEHEPSFKQYDPAPRYNARDSAIYLGQQLKAKVLLGSATPSIESYYHAKSGKYGLVEILERYGGVLPPQIDLLDLAKETKERTLQYHFSHRLLGAIENSLKEKDQVIIFQNRRGYAPLLVCKSCGYIPRCIHCDVSLTYHKSTQNLHCHYCGYHTQIPESCPICFQHQILDQGLGTEKIEEELHLLLPEARIGRMDLDTTRGKNGHWKILKELEENRIDILVGTQMVSKGLDFEKVQLIGVMNADQILNFPDFRAFERGFQILTQVSGRAGRRTRQGKVLIQTYTPKHPILQNIIHSDYKGFYQTEIYEREKFHYPPFTRLIKISIKNTSKESLMEFVQAITHPLKSHLGDMILGPEEALIPRMRNYYIQEFLVKMPRNSSSPAQIKTFILDSLTKLKGQKKFRTSIFQLDIDPA